MAQVLKLESFRNDPSFSYILEEQARRARAAKHEARVLSFRREAFRALWRKQYGTSF